MGGELGTRLKRDDRQRCHWEDLLLAKELALRPNISLANLGKLIADPNVVSPNGRWLGVHGPLAHWTRSEALQRLTAREFKRAAVEAPPSKLWTGRGSLESPSSTRPPPSPRTPQEPRPSEFICKRWRDSFPRLSKFPRGYRDWRLCEPSDGGRQWKQLRRVYLGAWRRPVKVDDELARP